MTDRQTVTGYRRSMSKIDDYRRGRELCAAKALKSPSGELRAIWQTIAETYKFLIELESRPETGLAGMVCAAEPASGVVQQPVVFVLDRPVTTA
jgi:hypothetical protein